MQPASLHGKKSLKESVFQGQERRLKKRRRREASKLEELGIGDYTISEDSTYYYSAKKSLDITKPAIALKNHPQFSLA